jgi:hypothetical protein
MSTPDPPTETSSVVPSAEPGPTPASEPVSAPAGPPPPASPWVPVYREPWVNPARRPHLIGVGVIALLVALGAGIGIGIAIGGHDHRDRPHDGVVVVPARGGYGPGMYGPHGQIGVLPGAGPGYDPGEVVPASPAPSASSTG